MGYDRKPRKGVMLCYPFEEARLEEGNRKSWGQWPVIVQPKLNGERCRAIIGPDGYVMLLSSTEEVIFSCPHINEELSRYPNFRGKELDGELYCHGRGFEEIHGAISRTVNFIDTSWIEYHIFDLVDEKIEQWQRVIWVEDFFKEQASPGNCLVKVQNILCYNIDDVRRNYKQICQQGYEGVIVRNFLGMYHRNRNTQIMKFKPKKKDWYEIVGWEEERDKTGMAKGTLGAFWCIGERGEEQFKVGSGFTQQQRKDFWAEREQLKGKFLFVEYQALSAKRMVPVFGITSENNEERRMIKDASDR